MKIAIAADHRGYPLKQELIKELSKKYNVIDLGTNNTESVDFPKYGILLGETIINHNADFGIAICGTGIGISIAANKVKGIMCAKVSTKEEAKLAKQHNRANILALSGTIEPKEALAMINEYLNATPLEEEKYLRRINEIKEYENEH